MSEGGYMRLSIRCPHCLGKSAAEDHEELSRTVGEIAYRCRNYRCGHVFAARLEVVRTLEPSRTPSPLVALPVSAHVRRAPVQAALLASECDADDEADYLAELAQPLADWPAAPSMGGALWGTAADAEADDAAERSRYRYITIRCPHCQAGAIAVASRELSRTLREVTYRCRSHRCRHAYVAQLEVVRTLSLSSLPCAEVVLPLSPHVRLGQLQALLQASAQAPPG